MILKPTDVKTVRYVSAENKGTADSRAHINSE